MPVPAIVDDGDFTATLQNGGMVWESPLANVGDFQHIVGRIKARCNTASFKPSNHVSLEPRSLMTGDGAKTVYLVGMSPSDIPGNNLMEWELTYANFPQSRQEATTVTYTQQWLAQEQNVVPANYKIIEFTNTRAATVTYDYFAKSSPLPLILAPRLEQVDSFIYSFGGWRPFVDGELVVAQDSSMERYLGDIFVRKTIRIQWTAALPIDPENATI